MAIQFTQNARKAVLWAQEEAMRLGHPCVEPEHLLLGLIHDIDSGAIRLLDRLGIAASQVRDAPAAKMSPSAQGPLTENSQLSPESKKLVDRAFAETEQSGDEYVGSEHLLLALLRGDGSAALGALGGAGPFLRAGGGPARQRPAGAHRDAALRAAAAPRSGGEAGLPAGARPAVRRGPLRAGDPGPVRATREIKSGRARPRTGAASRWR